MALNCGREMLAKGSLRNSRGAEFPVELCSESGTMEFLREA
jgi:hypothetical protein